MTKFAANDFAAIKAREEEIQAEKMKQLMGVPIEPPADIDWTMWPYTAVEVSYGSSSG